MPDTRKVFYRILRPRMGEGFTRDFSEGGCCVLLNEQLAPGSVLEIVFDMPGSKSLRITVTGRVMWQDNYLTGIKFLSPLQPSSPAPDAPEADSGRKG